MNNKIALIVPMMLLLLSAVFFVVFLDRCDSPQEGNPFKVQLPEYNSKISLDRKGDSSKQDLLQNVEIRAQHVSDKSRDALQCYLEKLLGHKLDISSHEGAVDIVRLLRNEENGIMVAYNLVECRVKSKHLMPELVAFYAEIKDGDNSLKESVLHLMGIQAEESAKEFLWNTFNSSRDEIEKESCMEGLYLLAFENEELMRSDVEIQNQLLTNLGKLDSVSLLSNEAAVGTLAKVGRSEIVQSLKDLFWEQASASIDTQIRMAKEGRILIDKDLCMALLLHNEAFPEELCSKYVSSSIQLQKRILGCLSAVRPLIVQRLYVDEKLLSQRWAPLSNIMYSALNVGDDEMVLRACDRLSSWKFLMNADIRSRLSELSTSHPNEKVRKRVSKLIRGKE